MSDYAHPEVYELRARLDAALRRIEQLELDVARLKGPRVYGGAYSQAVDQKIEAIAKSMELVSTCLDLGIDANGSPLPDEGT